MMRFPTPAPPAYLRPLLLVLAGGALLTAFRCGSIALLDGPNSTGEAGKVYFAKRYQAGESLFPPPLEPPYYPAVHGCLLHASVGELGALLSLDARGLYLAGRGVSLFGLVFVMMCAATWLRRLQLPLPFRVAALLMLTATTALMHHAVSYRPDYWILALSALSALLLLRPTRGWATVPLLAAIPAVAFYVKVTGVSILGSICVALWLQGSRRLAVGCFALGLFLLAGSIGVIDHLSEGGLRANLRSGGHMPFSLAFPLQLLAATPELILPLFAPLACLLLPHFKGPASRPMAVLYSFWGVSLLVGLSTSTRTGSNSYYFLEGFFYGTLILVYHLHHAAFLVRGVEGRAVGGWLLAVAWTGILVRSLVSPNHDYAARVTVRHGAHRAGLAAQINASKQACFCDDEGLNTLLERPAVIHPYVQTSLIAGGALPADTLSGPVYRQEYALILLVGDTMTHQEVETLSDPFRDALTRHYVEAPPVGRYRTFVPRK